MSQLISTLYFLLELFLPSSLLLFLTLKKIVSLRSIIFSPSSCLCLYHFIIALLGILLTFVPMHFLGFNLMPRRIPDFPDSFHSWNFLSSIGSGITFLSFAIFQILTENE